MKCNLKYLMFGLLALVFASCDKHDNMDDIVHVGEMAPHVHWTIPNTVVTAGSDVAFSVQYYTTEEDAKNVAARLDSNYLNAEYVKVEHSKKYENVILGTIYDITDKEFYENIED